MRYMSTNVEKTASIASEFAKSLKNPGVFSKNSSKLSKATIVGLYGDLGSGKTCFMQGVGATLGISENIVSPTFVIEKIYKLEHDSFSHLIHIDAYRLEKAEELLHLGWQEIIDNPANLIC